MFITLQCLVYTGFFIISNTGPPNNIIIIFGGRLLYVDCVIGMMVQPRKMTKQTMFVAMFVGRS